MSELKTQNLIIRAMQSEDIPIYVALQMNPQMRRYRQCYPNEVWADWQAQKMVWANNNLIDRHRDRWVMSIFLNNSGTMIGDIGVHLDIDQQAAGITYGLRPDLWGQGYITEALGCVTDYAHNALGIQKIVEPVIAENTASWRAMEKCGYKRIGEELISWEKPEIKDRLVYIYQSLPR